MKRFHVIHQTIYHFMDPVTLAPHTLRLRPREGHEQHIASSILTISPPALLRWHRDVEGNSVAIASFDASTTRLEIKSETLVQKYDLAPEDFLIADYAVTFPFEYQSEDQVILSAYMATAHHDTPQQLSQWLKAKWEVQPPTDTFTVLLELNQYIYQTISYQIREEEGVQTPITTIELKTGSCRDMATLFMEAAKSLGFATRFVSGYVFTEADSLQSGSTHAWVEVFIPGAGWKGFDPTFGNMVGAEHIAVAVARRPEIVPPIAGDFFGKSGATMEVKVVVEDMT